MNKIVNLDKSRINNKLEHLIFFLLNEYTLYSLLQSGRIKQDIKNNDRLSTYADINFLLVSISNFKKAFRKFKKLRSDDKSLVDIFKKHIKQLEKISVFRDNVEHFPERLLGKDKKNRPLKNPGMLGQLDGYVYNFGGEKIDLQELFDLMEEIQSDLSQWNTSLDGKKYDL